MDYYKVKKDETKARANNCPISLKFSVELASFIKGKPVKKVVNYLNDVEALKRHVPLRRYNRDVGHKKGEAQAGVKSGRYPIKVAAYFKKVIESAIKNAENLGLDPEKLLLRGVVVSQGVRRFKMQAQGRRRRQRSKSTNIEVVVKEVGGKKISPEAKAKQEAPKKVTKGTPKETTKEVTKETTKEIKKEVPKVKEPKVVEKKETKAVKVEKEVKK
jgi:large subunit ribosomal protein L22